MCIYIYIYDSFHMDPYRPMVPYCSMVPYCPGSLVSHVDAIPVIGTSHFYCYVTCNKYQLIIKFYTKNQKSIITLSKSYQFST